MLGIRLWSTQGKEAAAGVYIPLALFFIINALTELPPLFMQPAVLASDAFWPRLIATAFLPLHLLLAPLFWVYVRTLTAEQQIVWQQTDLRHCVPALVALAAPVIAVYMGQGEFLNLFERPRLRTTNQQYALIWLIQLIEAALIVQVAFYIVLILRRLAQYRDALVQLFASTEHLELRWVRWLALFLVSYAIVSAISSVTTNPFLLEPWESIIDLALLWFIIVWGLRQKPGLAPEVAATEKANQQGDNRYEHSGLTSEQRRLIAEKIAVCMQDENLHRNPNLSLRVLAEHIGELPNYVSQALNQELGDSFFDYVNRWRVEEAKQQLAQSSLTVLAIAEATGFNSRSSFYNAFKKSTGQTPSAYKKAQATV